MARCRPCDAAPETPMSDPKDVERARKAARDLRAGMTDEEREMLGAGPITALILRVIEETREWLDADGHKAGIV